MSTMTDTWTLTVPDGLERQEDTSITPGNYRVHRLQGGSYPVTYTTRRGEPVNDPEMAYYAEALVPSVLVREASHQRLGAAARYEVKDLEEAPSAYCFRFYAYEVREAGPLKYRPELTLERRSA